MTAPGSDQPGGRTSQDRRAAADALHDELIRRLIRVDERGRLAAVLRVNRQRNLLVEVLRGLERAVAVSDQDLHVAQGVAHEQVGVGSAGQVRDRQAVGLEADVDLGRRQEATVAVAVLDVEPVGGEDGQSGWPLSLKSTVRMTSGLPGVGKIVGIGKRPSPGP